jgi:hypothetical protein
MAASVSRLIKGWSPTKTPVVDVLDAMTSKSSTFPYDGDTMKRMIELTQKAKSTPLSCKEMIGWLICNSEASGGLAYYTAATSEYTVHPLIIHYLRVHLARLLSFFGKISSNFVLASPL